MVLRLVGCSDLSGPWQSPRCYQRPDRRLRAAALGSCAQYEERGNDGLGILAEPAQDAAAPMWLPLRLMGAGARAGSWCFLLRPGAFLADRRPAAQSRRTLARAGSLTWPCVSAPCLSLSDRSPSRTGRPGDPSTRIHIQVRHRGAAVTNDSNCQPTGDRCAMVRPERQTRCSARSSTPHPLRGMARGTTLLRVPIQPNALAQIPSLGRHGIQWGASRHPCGRGERCRTTAIGQARGQRAGAVKLSLWASHQPPPDQRALRAF
ncbi:hypothetical protein C8Q79DRAFT_137338 [Trametes meyenii]|nr:hypothetical protein C8Q79DRAFT_137338 [Trametes meyenii]